MQELAAEHNCVGPIFFSLRPPKVILALLFFIRLFLILMSSLLVLRLFSVPIRLFFINVIIIITIIIIMWDGSPAAG